MRNVTVTMDEAGPRRARVAAAGDGESPSRLEDRRHGRTVRPTTIVIPSTTGAVAAEH